MTIAIVSHLADDHAAAVMRVLAAAGRRALLIDTSRFPSGFRLALELGPGLRSLCLTGDQRAIDLDELGVIWWRRPQPYRLDEQMDSSFQAFAYSECHEALNGMWHSLRATWVNPPAADEVAHHKPLQLAVAREVGLTIPPTLITNDPAAARRFLSQREGSRVIYKTFMAHEDHWRETRLVTDRERELLDSLRLAPVIFQDFVPAEADLRISVFGQVMHAVEIVTPPGSYAYDYRIGMDQVSMRAVDVPDAVGAAILRLMKRLGLVYGAVDMRRTAEGDHIFLEVNPSGEFLFVEAASGLPLAQAMADLLISLDKPGNDEKAES